MSKKFSKIFYIEAMLMPAMLCSLFLLFGFGPQLYYTIFPGSAPRTPSVLIRNPILSASFTKVLNRSGVHDIACRPHGTRSNVSYVYEGWTCTGHTLAAQGAMGSAFEEDLRIKQGYGYLLNKEGSLMAQEGQVIGDIAPLYRQGLAFSADVDEGVKVSIDPKMASLDDVQNGINNLTLGAGQLYREAQVNLPVNQATPIEDANLASWKR